jgi:hypothetical protein
MGRRDGLLGQSQHVIPSMKQEKDAATATISEGSLSSSHRSSALPFSRGPLKTRSRISVLHRGRLRAYADLAAKLRALAERVRFHVEKTCLVQDVERYATSLEEQQERISVRH